MKALRMVIRGQDPGAQRVDADHTVAMPSNQRPGTQADPPTVADRVGRVLSDDELVDEASEESFPASDAPAWNRGHDHSEHGEQDVPPDRSR
jgi:hypothetical protein